MINLVAAITALPGGYRNSVGNYYYMGGTGYFWSSTENISSSAWYRVLDYHHSDVYRYYSNRHSGISVRCVRDY